MDNTTQMRWWNTFYGKHRFKLWVIQGVLLLVIGFSAAWIFDSTPPSETSTSNVLTTEVASVPTMWTCSMHPQIRSDKPGKCPICGMDLVPVKKSAGGVRTISIGSEIKKLMNLQTVPVARQYVTANVRMVGKIEYDETRLAYVTAWVSGRLDRLFVDFTGVEVHKGDHMVSIYSEELYSAQEELIQALKYRSESQNSNRFSAPIDLVKSAREKLRLLGITEKQIQEIEQRGKPIDHITIYSPVSGIVIAKLRQEGDRVNTGDRIYTLADLTQLWMQMDAYESDLAWLRYGQEVEFTTEAYPGEVFKGRIAFIDPVLNEMTRTVKVRVNVPNEDGRLKPEMFVSAIVRSKVAAGGRVIDPSLAGKWIGPMHPEIVKDEPGNCDICGMPLVRAETLGYVTAEPSDTAKPLVIPVSAALLTGTRAIVYVQVPNTEEPTYEGREIVLGPRAGDYYLVKSGLKEGELVVTNGNFKLDSALQISAKPSMMTPEGGGSAGGHNHGGETKAGGNGDEMKMSGGSGMTLPPELKTKLFHTMESVEAISQAVKSKDLDRIHESYITLGELIAAVNAMQLPGDMGDQLQEFVMLLRNDSIEGGDVQTLQDAEHVTQITNRHAERLQEMFGLFDTGHQMAEIKLDVPDAFRQQLSQLIPSYLALSEALAADDANGAKMAVESLEQSVSSLKNQSLEGATDNRWKAEHNDLIKITEQLAKANDLDGLRSAFALLSEQMLSLQRTFGFAGAHQLFELHCPMIFDGRGASWIQADETVRNPYYGGSMLKCADRVEPLTVKDSGHDHG
ncbi:efflux RND transporter periplasmic adaptor subunit [Bythopirellula goksoeyrii]|uniref:Cation efflux system protein CusB n=1 Tax=Bythopirellula goksoeyrii TaxID=1400387 RepID=A0A5B9QDS7_9BACT|nr:efflux RND transporter periplasmic adaptor subunit [Bythopirellula goksoeyrii]QEG35785.1 Cation efflux system protein CusB precursor [Bythopirellula goksoeyrii]